MIATLAGVTLKRLARGKALWIGGLLAALPAVYAGAARARHLAFSAEEAFQLPLLLLAVLPAMFVGASVGEELEDRTCTYLWSRPIARWAVLAGKLCALIPVVVALSVAGWCAAAVLGGRQPPPVASCVALAAGCIASSLAVAGIAVVAPSHGMALAIGYMLVDLFVGALPFSAHELSITHQTAVLAGLSGAGAIATPLIALAVISALGGGLGVARIRRLEV